MTEYDEGELNIAGVGIAHLWLGGEFYWCFARCDSIFDVFCSLTQNKHTRFESKIKHAGTPYSIEAVIVVTM